MHRFIFTSLAALAVFGVVLAAQETGTPARQAQPATTQAVQTFTGTSAAGNVQEALNDSLTKAQQTLSKTVADGQFRWQLDTLTGTRGGIAGSMACEVKIRILP